MNDFMNSYFGPIDKSNCAYFYLLSVFFGVSFALGLASLVIYIITDMKKIDKDMVVVSIYGLINAFVLYFVNRLLHTMCTASLA